MKLEDYVKQRNAAEAEERKQARKCTVFAYIADKWLDFVAIIIASL